MKLTEKYYSFIISSSSKRIRDVGYIAFLSVAFKILVNYFPLKWYYKYFFNNHRYNEQELQPYIYEMDQIKRITKSLPWDSSCLVESFIMQTYFKKYDLLLPIELGISMKDDFCAHAWNLESSRRGFTKIQIK